MERIVLQYVELNKNLAALSSKGYKANKLEDIRRLGPGWLQDVNK